MNNAIVAAIPRGAAIAGISLRQCCADTPLRQDAPWDAPRALTLDFGLWTLDFDPVYGPKS
jgi:hypothetical protein